MNLAHVRELAVAGLAWSGLLSLLVLAACGPEEGFAPRSGVYRYEVAMLENSCDPLFDDDGMGDAQVEVEGDAIVVPMSQVLSYAAPKCEGCVPPVSSRQWTTRFEAEEGLYVAAMEWGPDPGGCLRERVELEVLGDRTLQARVMVEVARDQACPWADATTADCVVAREYTYTLLED